MEACGQHVAYGIVLYYLLQASCLESGSLPCSSLVTLPLRSDFQASLLTYAQLPFHMQFSASHVARAHSLQISRFMRAMTALHTEPENEGRPHHM